MSFSNDIRRFRANTSRRVKSIYRASVQDLGRTANTPIAQGGNLPVDTGFLRNSQAYALNEMPSGPTRNETGRPVNDRIGDGPVLVLAQWRPGDAVYIGWSASYARYMESRYGFSRLAAQQWPDIVARNARGAG